MRETMSTGCKQTIQGYSALSVYLYAFNIQYLKGWKSANVSYF